MLSEHNFNKTFKAATILVLFLLLTSCSGNKGDKGYAGEAIPTQLEGNVFLRPVRTTYDLFYFTNNSAIGTTVELVGTGTSKTDKNGYFKFNNVIPNIYKIKATCNGFETNEQNVRVQSGGNVPTYVRLDLFQIPSTTITSIELISSTDTSNIYIKVTTKDKDSISASKKVTLLWSLSGKIDLTNLEPLSFYYGRQASTGQELYYDIYNLSFTLSEDTTTIISFSKLNLKKYKSKSITFQAYSINENVYYQGFKTIEGLSRTGSNLITIIID